MIEWVSGQITTTPMRRGQYRFASRGQALIIAVLIMFLLAGLGGVFLALINNAQYQSARAEDRSTLENIARTGLNHAVNELMYSPEGAEWRPDNNNDAGGWTWVDLNGKDYKGRYRIDVSYGPSGAVYLENPLDRFIKVSVEAQLGVKKREVGGPPPANGDDAAMQTFFITRKITALVPIGLPDYLKWITNIDGSPDPVYIGTLGEPMTISTLKHDPCSVATDPEYNDPANAVSVNTPALSLYEGSIFSNAPVKLGNTRIDLTIVGAPIHNVHRRDNFLIAGGLDFAEGASPLYSRLVVNGQNQPMGTLASGVVYDPVATLQNASDAANCRPFLMTKINNPQIRAMPSPKIDLRNPATGLDRYRALTRDSAAYDDSFTYNSGALGWGEGIYVNNPNDIQQGGDIEKLRREWLEPTNPMHATWQEGVYHPEQRAVTAVLYDWTIPDLATGVATQRPYIELRRYDGTPFRDKNNVPLAANFRDGYYYVQMDYPKNGVIFAEGNIVVKSGDGEGLPASLAFQYDAGSNSYLPVKTAGAQQPGGWNPADGSISYYRDAANRRYDLTIVSGGTVYIEGNLLSPSSRNAVSQADGLPNGVAITQGSDYDSKLALLARDNVCLNPTKLLTTVNKLPEVVGNENVWRLGGSDPEPLTFAFSTAGGISANTRILLRHAGESVLAGPSNSVLRMAVNNQPYKWNPAAASYPTNELYFCDQTLMTTIFPGLTLPSWGGGLFDVDPLNMQTWSLTDSGKLPVNTLQGYGARNTIALQWVGGADYLLAAGDGFPGFVVTGIDLQVDALVFAQRGSWFIIPGRYYNEDDTRPMPWPFPKNKEPLDVRIIFNGAIVENRPAPPEAEEAWTQHWRGSNMSYFDADGDGKPDLLDPAAAGWDSARRRWNDSRRMGIEYHYDETLARPVCHDIVDGKAVNYRPRLPKLPVSPSVFSVDAMRGI